MNKITLLKICMIITLSTFLSACSMSGKTVDQDFEYNFTKQRNHVQSGRVLEDQGDVYFSVLSETTYDKQKTPTYHGSIFRTDTKGNQLVEIADHYASYMTIHNNWLYFSSENIYRMPKDGGKIELLISGNDLEFTIHKNRIYFVEKSIEDGIYESSLDGSSQKKIFDGGASNLTVIRDTIYSVRKADFKLHATSIRNNESNSVINASVAQYCIDDQHVIYTDDGLYIQTLNEGAGAIKIDDFVSTFNLHGDWVYYISAVEGDVLKPTLIKARRDGSERVTLLDNDMSYYDMEIYIAGNWIYLFNPYEADQFIRLSLDGGDLEVLRLGKDYKGGSTVEILNKSL